MYNLRCARQQQQRKKYVIEETNKNGRVKIELWKRNECRKYH